MRHTGGVNPSGVPDPTTPFSAPRRARTSVGQVFALVAGFIALAAVGAAIGWTLTGSPSGPAHDASPSLSPSTPVSAPPPSPSPSPSPSASGDYVIPDYQSAGVLFTTARDDLRSHKLGVALIFNESGSGSTVVGTTPQAGTSVTKGTTVKVYVSGPAPTLQVPSVLGEACGAGGKDLAAAGLNPQYPNGRKGKVALTDPAPGAPNVRWNQQIKVICTPDGSPPTPSDAPSTPSSGSTPSPGTLG